MSAEGAKEMPQAEPGATEGSVELRKLLEGQAVDDVVESFSKGFREDLRRILGERYRERPKRGT